MKVKVTKSPSGEYWYNDRIGEIIEVSNSKNDDGSRDVLDWHGYDDGVLKNIAGLYIEADDFEVVEESTVTITVEEYQNLKYDSDLLSCLDACGVDNWDGWSDALRMMESEEEEEDDE